MKRKILALSIVFAIILLLQFMAFRDNYLAGYATAEVQPPSVQKYSRNDAVTAIQRAEEDMKEMIEAGFGTAYINDTLLSAKKAFERADYIEKLEKKQLPDIIGKAKEVFGGEEKGLTYSDVIAYAEEISSRKAKAYELNDLLRAAELKAEDYRLSGIDIAKAWEQLDAAHTAFSRERYDEAEQSLADADASMESAKAELTLVRVMARTSKTFLRENWKQIALALSLLLALALFIIYSIHLHDVRKKLATLKIEKDVLIQLLKDTQRARFVTGTISGKTYKIRMGKFKERLHEIEHIIPVMESVAHVRRARKK